MGLGFVRSDFGCSVSQRRVSMNTIRIIIADNHPIIVQGIRGCLAQHPQIRVVGVAESFAALFSLLVDRPADVVILDLQDMHDSPLTTVERLRRLYPQLGIVVFSSTTELAPELLDAGVHGYISKEDLPDLLPQAIMVAHRGERTLSPGVRAYIQQITALQQRERLTNKELSVLKLVAQGLKTITIGETMGIDPRCAQNYITVLRRKTGCTTRTGLAEWYRRNIFAQDQR
jgi:DNA-binding NarL/FixJ family response regulator